MTLCQYMIEQLPCYESESAYRMTMPSNTLRGRSVVGLVIGRIRKVCRAWPTKDVDKS
jgi:hypothetical protein